MGQWSRVRPRIASDRDLPTVLNNETQKIRARRTACLAVSQAVERDVFGCHIHALLELRHSHVWIIAAPESGSTWLLLLLKASLGWDLLARVLVRPPHAGTVAMGPGGSGVSLICHSPILSAGITSGSCVRSTCCFRKPGELGTVC